ncbi:MAG: hydroxymethylbilane synthase [Candidatus Lindowbacteria bacterium]|nr:hydroxymethylbilane synthase [Candidatus Lindowbacteria bacterium]
MNFRIATRASNLAMTQSLYIRDLLMKETSIECEIVKISTLGDRDNVSDLAAIGGTGVFTKEVEKALLNGDAEIAVHSLKDIPAPSADPSDTSEILRFSAFPIREDARDAFVPSKSNAQYTLVSLPEGSKIATSSPRRAALIAQSRPDIQIVPIRGNVETRLKKIDQGEADATFLAVAGIHRLNIDRPYTPMPLELFPPAAGQGILAVQSAKDDVHEILKQIDNPEVRRIAEAERTILGNIGGGCNHAVGIHIVKGWYFYGCRQIGDKLVRFEYESSDLEEIVATATEKLKL